MRRRDFIMLLGGALSVAPLSVRAQKAESARRLVVLMTGRVNAQLRMETIQRGLQSRGWTEGRNISIEYRWAVGDAAQVQEFAKELVGRQPDVAIVQGSIAVQALLHETNTIPIVFVQVANPVAQGFVASAANPGGNVTGFSNFVDSMGGKWLALLKEIAPDVSSAAVIANPTTNSLSICLGLHRGGRPAGGRQIGPGAGPRHGRA